MAVRMSAVVMMVVTVTIVMMVVPRRVIACGRVISAALRCERRLDGAERRAEPAQHVGDHMVVPDQDAMRHDLRREMPVAEMPGETQQARDFR